MFLVDTERGRIISDEELKQEIISARPYRQWLNEHTLYFEQLPDVTEEQPAYDHEATLQRLRAFWLQL